MASVKVADIDVEGVAATIAGEGIDKEKIQAVETTAAEVAENAAEVLYEAAQVHDAAKEDATNRGEEVLRVHTD